MEFDVQSRDFPLTEPLREALLMSARQYRETYRRLVRKVAVRVHDVPGPNGAVEKSCVVMADLVDGQVLVVSDADADLYRAIPRAFAKARRGAQAARRRLRTKQRAAMLMPVALVALVALDAG